MAPRRSHNDYSLIFRSRSDGSRRPAVNNNKLLLGNMVKAMDSPPQGRFKAV
jgi:hypothetical protein